VPPSRSRRPQRHANRGRIATKSPPVAAKAAILARAPVQKAPLGPKRGREAAGVAVAFTVAFAFALSFGLNFGTGNQTSYLLAAIHRLDPNLLRRDWFVTETTQYHLVYTELGAALLALDPSGRLMAALNLVLVTATGLAVYAMCRMLAGPRGALPSFFLTMAFAFAKHWPGPLTTYVFDEAFQPSGLASAFFIGAAAAFVAGRFGWSGVLLGLTAVSHLNMLVLVLPAFGLAQLLLGREALGRRLLLQLPWAALAALPFLPMMVRANLPVPNADFARHVWVAVRFPHHFGLRAHLREFLPFCAWVPVAALVLRPFYKLREEAAFGRLAALLAGLVAVIGAGTAGALLTERLAALFAWRLVAHCIVFAELAISVVVVRLLLEPALWPRLPHALARGARLARVTAAYPAVVGIACALLLVNYAVGPLARMPHHSNLLVHDTDPRSELETWMRERSPRDALFLIPPKEETLRFRGERAVVIDWKSTPSIPAQILEWYRRICDVAGREVHGEADLAGYARLDPPRLAALRQRYAVDFAVVERKDAAKLAGYTAVYSNTDYTVFDALPDGAKTHAER
jgi:hypothetical protein